jgi:hypothetical protein
MSHNRFTRVLREGMIGSEGAGWMEGFSCAQKTGFHFC